MRTLSEPRVMDVRQMTGPDHCEAVLGAFDALVPGEALVVVSDHLPQRLLGRLQSERKGQFEWSPLEAGPERHRTEIVRRPADQGEMRGVSEALAWDHDRLDEIEARAFALFERGDAEGARAAWAEFSFG